jgi:hypothetical protein
MERINNNINNTNDNGFNSLKGEFTIVIGPLSATAIFENDNNIELLLPNTAEHCNFESRKNSEPLFRKGAVFK